MTHQTNYKCQVHRVANAWSIDMAPYVPRIADAELASRLAASGAVLIEGPRACGKTETARRQAASEVLLDVDDNARRAMDIDPGLVLAGEVPRLIDEWQVEPRVWNHVRRAVDARRASGQFILTGSSVPADDSVRHTGAGRMSRLRLRTMTSREVGVSTGEASLGALLRGSFEGCARSELRLEDLAAHICRGGWPGDRGRSVWACLTARVDYLEEIRRVDISRVDGVSRDPENVGRLLRALARNVATTVSARTLAADAGGAEGPLDADTVRSYLRALGRLMVIEEQPAWSPRLRSRSLLRKSPKRHFVDPSLAVAALGASPDRLLRELDFLGFLFESMVYRDISVYARARDAQVYHYRDNTDLEVDQLVQARSGPWCAFEVKLGGGQVDAAADALLRFRDRLDLTAVGAPGTLAVVVGSGYGYRREDGVCVIPVGALGP